LLLLAAFFGTLALLLLLQLLLLLRRSLRWPNALALAKCCCCCSCSSSSSSSSFIICIVPGLLFVLIITCQLLALSFCELKLLTRLLSDVGSAFFEPCIAPSGIRSY
jgi:hypothetical protein